jgi:hypothetical protein
MVYLNLYHGLQSSDNNKSNLLRLIFGDAAGNFAPRRRPNFTRSCAPTRFSGGLGFFEEFGLGRQCSPALSTLCIEIVSPPLHHRGALL